MAKRGGGAGRWILLAVVSLFLAAVLCCCSGVALLWYSPMMFVNWLVEDEPYDLPELEADPAVAMALEQKLQAGGPVSITGDELMAAVAANDLDDGDLAGLWIDVAGDQAEMKLSVDMGEDMDGYLNVHVRGAFVMEQGWFTHLEMDTMTVGPMELGSYIAGQEMAQDANRSLADARSENPEAAMMLDEVVRFETGDGAFVIEFEDGGWERIKSIRR